jgi:plastocyanin
MRRIAIRAGLVLLLLTSTALVGEASAGARGTAIPATTRERVKIVDFAFHPKTLSIAKGTKVKWVNKGSTSHTTTSNKGLWDSGVLAPGQTFSRVFKKAGTFKYHCTIHPTMVGKIVVG